MEIAIRKLSYKGYFRNLTVTLNDNHIIGIMGRNYQELLYLIGSDKVLTNNILYNNLNIGDRKSNYIGYIDKNLNFYTSYVYDELLLYLNRYSGKVKNHRNRFMKILDMFSLDENFLDKKISDLSSGEMKLLKYLLVLVYNPNVIVIDEPYLYLDFYYKKVIKKVLYDLKTKYHKTIIVGSNDSNIIYSLCDISLFVNRDNHLYGITKSIFNEEELKKFSIKVPDLVRFTDLAKKKGINIGYFQDIRDLIKDVYRNV